MNSSANTPIADKLGPMRLLPARSVTILVATDGSETVVVAEPLLASPLLPAAEDAASNGLVASTFSRMR